MRKITIENQLDNHARPVSHQARPLLNDEGTGTNIMKEFLPLITWLKTNFTTKTIPVTVKRSVLTTAFSIAGLLLAISHTPASAKADSFKVKKTHGHWHLSCGTPPGAKNEKCALVQDVTDETRPNYSLRVIFLRSKDGKKEVLRVVAPLGVLLPPGLGLKIDNADMGHAPFMKCGKIGCIAEVVVNDQIVKKFQTGKNAIFIIFQTPEVGIGFPVSLNGFGDGYKTLK